MVNLVCYVLISGSSFSDEQLIDHMQSSWRVQEMKCWHQREWSQAWRHTAIHLPKERALLEASCCMVLLGKDLCCLLDFCNSKSCWEEFGTLNFPETPHLCRDTPVGSRSRKLLTWQHGLLELDLGGAWTRKALYLGWRCCFRLMEKKCSPLKIICNSPGQCFSHLPVFY